MSNPLLAPQPLTMDRYGDRDELVLSQSTSQCCRFCCWQPSINWVMSEGDNFVPGTDPLTLDSTGWIHEESGFTGRCWSWMIPGCRQIKYVQHHGPPPVAILGENKGWCECQKALTTKGLTVEDQASNVVAIHEKVGTCGFCFKFGDITFPICNCCPLPYLETKDSNGQVLGRTNYICDMCCFVPKYDVVKANNETPLYRIRPDTCCLGLCVRCRCGGKRGKAFRVPFIVRNAATKEPIKTDAARWPYAQIDNLWTGWKNECCTQKDAYHLAFPEQASTEDKLLLTGAALLVDVTMFEQDQNN